MIIIFISYLTSWWETNKYVILDVILKGKLIYSDSYVLLSSSVFSRHNGSILSKEREKILFIFQVSLKEAVKFPENSSAILSWRSWSVPASLKLNVEGHQVYWVGNKEQKNYDSAVCFQGVGRQTKEPEMHLCGSQAHDHPNHVMKGRHPPPSSKPSLLRVTASCSSLLTDDRHYYNRNHVLKMFVIWRAQVSLWASDTCIGFWPQWEM